MDGNEGTPEVPAIDTAPELDLAATIRQELEAQGEPVDDSAGATPQPGENKPTTYTLSDGTEVPLEELERGWLRQSDYTRKTQEVSALRQEAEQALRLMQALSENPAETLEALQRNLQLDTEDDLDPYEQQLRAHEERFAQLEQERFDQELEYTLQTLQDQYADRGFVPEEVLQYAIDNEIPNLRAAFLALEEDKAADAERQQRNAEALGRKQTLPPLGGRSRQLGGDAPEFVEVHNVRDAMRNALAELDLS